MRGVGTRPPRRGRPGRVSCRRSPPASGDARVGSLVGPGPLAGVSRGSAVVSGQRPGVCRSRAAGPTGGRAGVVTRRRSAKREPCGIAPVALVYPYGAAESDDARGLRTRGGGLLRRVALVRALGRPGVDRRATRARTGGDVAGRHGRVGVGPRDDGGRADSGLRRQRRRRRDRHRLRVGRGGAHPVGTRRPHTGAGSTLGRDDAGDRRHERGADVVRPGHRAAGGRRLRRHRGSGHGRRPGSPP